MSETQEATFAMRQNDDLGRVEFGAVVDGVFHPLATIPNGDYLEAQAAGKQAQADSEAAASGQDG